MTAPVERQVEQTRAYTDAECAELTRRLDRGEAELLREAEIAFSRIDAAFGDAA